MSVCYATRRLPTVVARSGLNNPIGSIESHPCVALIAIVTTSKIPCVHSWLKAFTVKCWCKAMAKFDIKSVALKWYFFTTASISVYEEFSHVFMKQFGLNSQQIGITNLCGVQHIFIPLLLYVGDRYRVRNLVIWIVSPLLAISSLLLLLPIVVSLPTCFGTKSGSNNSCKTIYI